MLKHVFSNPILLAVAGMVLLAGLARVLLLLRQKGTRLGNSPYESAVHLLSPAERSFMGVVEAALEPGFALLPKVRLADLVSVRKGLSRAETQGAFNRISSKHVDFTLCYETDFSIAAVIELDDQTHLRKSRVARDEFVDQVLAAAGIPVLHIKAEKYYEPQVLSAQLATLMQAGPCAPEPLLALNRASQA